MSTVTEAIAAPSSAEPEPAPRRRRGRVALWVGIPLALAAAGAAYASALFIAPGVTVAGTPVGWMTADAAEDAIRARIAGADVVVGGATMSTADLGVTVDAEALARQALETHPLWNLSGWDPEPIEAALAIDPVAASGVLRAQAPELFADPVDAQVAFDEAAGRFAATPAVPGRGVDLAALEADLAASLTAGGALTAKPLQTERAAAIRTEAAEAFAAGLNDQAGDAGFHVDGGGSVPIDLATLASWIEISADPATGGFAIAADVAAIDELVKTLPERLNTAPVPGQVVTNSAGAVLRTIQAGQDGFGIGSTDGLAEKVAASVNGGDLRFELQGTVIPHESQALMRTIEVDKSAGTTLLYENGALIASYPVAIGTGGAHETRTGHYTVYVQRAMQDMGDCNGGDYGYGYCTEKVPWVSFFNGDQGFHGTYWHGNFGAGARMSHGCVNMTIAAAEHLYRFAQVGTEVWVHD
ncbi:murein L,D-transpeptidase [Microbacterium paludicola]|uniref:Murein L,D-transpeptidase n=1 Tax=Microbacterium paludicola TaxID=300019 RepID=A0A4Y9FST9_9MICO|nr:L,D-transpeptidase [Microbacterium paludicola]MBF0817407.1 L,D-transpeptidase [Microbacterium paludicola]TFU31328.1 murein L,D-transpeptidase [Microbacterium paludicola]